MNEAHRLNIQVGQDQVLSTYSNMAHVWANAYDFTIDFCQLQPARRDEDGLVTDAPVAARVTIPPTMVFDLIRAINEAMTKYEEQFGEIRPPGEPQPGGPPEQGG